MDAANRRHVPGDREVPERVTTDDLHDATDADGALGIGAVAGIAEQRRRRAPLRVGERQGTRREAGDAEHRDVVDPSNETTCASRS